MTSDCFIGRWEVTTSGSLVFTHVFSLYYYLYNQWFSFFISKFKILNFFLPLQAFVWTFHIDFFSINDEWHHLLHGVALNCPCLYSLLSLSFWSRWLPLFVGFFCLALYQWISLHPSLWYDFQSLHGLLGRICWSYALIVYYELPHMYNDVISTVEVTVKCSDKSFYR